MSLKKEEEEEESLLTDQQYTVNHQEIHDDLVQLKSQIHYAQRYLLPNQYLLLLLALDMMPS
jgi:hypothetical protein